MMRQAYIWLAAMAVLLLMMAAFVRYQAQVARVAEKKATLSGKQFDAAMASGADAVDAIGAAQANGQQIDREVSDVQDRIYRAVDADAAGDAAVAGLCRHAAYRAEPRCLQFTPAR